MSCSKFQNCQERHLERNLEYLTWFGSRRRNQHHSIWKRYHVHVLSCCWQQWNQLTDITSEPIEDDTNANEIRNEILIISLGGSILEEKQEKSVGMYQSVIPLAYWAGVNEWGPNYILHWKIDQKATAITSPPPAKATATVVLPTSMAHIRHYLRKEDIERLQPLQWLNDDIISFGIRYALIVL
jgi:hypothetical protein